MGNREEFELYEIRLGDLRPLELPAHQAVRRELEGLPDEALLKAVVHPQNLDFVVINTRTDLLHDGNGRILELQRRANKGSAIVSLDTMIPVEFYTPDLSMFPDLD